MKSRQSAAAIAFRKRLSAGRRFFMKELEKARPNLRDSWYPWLIAFGLGRQVDYWSSRNPSTTAPTDSFTSSHTTSHTSSSGGVPAATGWSGGGGLSGGAGATGTWAVAAAGMAAGVAAPGSESSGNGGSSSGGSSGGGGGGGW